MMDKYDHLAADCTAMLRAAEACKDTSHRKTPIPFQHLSEHVDRVMAFRDGEASPGFTDQMFDLERIDITDAGALRNCGLSDSDLALHILNMVLSVYKLPIISAQIRSLIWAKEQFHQDHMRKQDEPG